MSPAGTSTTRGALLGQIPEAEGIESGDVGGEHPRLVLQRAVEQHIAVAHAHGFRLGEALACGRDGPLRWPSRARVPRAIAAG